jgi:hypothetical protein
MKYIATAHFEETISYFGEGDTPEKALEDFMKESFYDHCDSVESESGDIIEIGVFETIKNGDPLWDDEMYDPDWQWVLTKRLDTKNITVE